MNIYDEVNELLEPIDLALDLMKKFIQPAVFSGLKSNMESIKHTIKRREKRAKKEHELLELYKQQKRDREENSLSSTTLYWVIEKEIAIKEKELEEIK